jgi:hypothetical protein
MKIDRTIVKKIGHAFKNGVFSNHHAYSDGYLLEKRPDKVTMVPVARDSTETREHREEDGYDIIALSLIGTKRAVEKKLKDFEEEPTCFQRSDRCEEEFTTKDAGYEVPRLIRVSHFQTPLSLLETEQVTRADLNVTMEGPEEGLAAMLSIFWTDVESNMRIKTGRRVRFITPLNQKNTITVLQDAAKLYGCTITRMNESNEGTLFKRFLLLNPKCRPELLDGDSKEAYLVGESLEEARKQFWSAIDRLTPPFQPEWEDTIWNEFEKRGWLTELPGHRLVGYKLHLDQDLLLDMLSEALIDGSLPVNLPEEPAEAPETATEPEAEQLAA